MNAKQLDRYATFAGLIPLVVETLLTMSGNGDITLKDFLVGSTLAVIGWLTNKTAG